MGKEHGNLRKNEHYILINHFWCCHFFSPLKAPELSELHIEGFVKGSCSVVYTNHGQDITVTLDQLPPTKQDPLLGSLEANHMDNDENQNPPSFKQNPLLHPLTPKHEGQFKGLNTPSERQNPLLRPLTGVNFTNILQAFFGT